MPRLDPSRRRDGGRRECIPFQGVDIINNIRNLAAAILAGTTFAAQAQSIDAMAPTHWKFGVQFGTVQDHANTEPVVQLSLGYEFNRNFAVEALGNVSLLFIRMGNLKNGDREFNSAIGARLLGTLPLSERWNLVGGLGIVQFSDEIGLGEDTRSIDENKTSPMVSLAATYRMSRRWSFGLEASSFTQAHTFNAGLRGEFHF